MRKIEIYLHDHELRQLEELVGQVALAEIQRSPEDGKYAPRRAKKKDQPSRSAVAREAILAYLEQKLAPAQ